MYHCFLGTRVTACPNKLYRVPLTQFLPCFSATTASLSPVHLAPTDFVALLGLILGELAGKLTGTVATASVACYSVPLGGVFGPLVEVL